MADALSGITRWLVSFLLRRTCRTLDEIDVAPTKVLDLDRPHRGVGRDDRGAVDVFPFRTRRGCLEEPLPFLGCQGAADWVLSLWEVVDVVCDRTPAAAGLEDPRQHTHVHVDRAVRDAGLVPRALKLGDRRRGDR